MSEALSLPTPNTGCVRVLQSEQRVQPATADLSSGHCMPAIASICASSAIAADPAGAGMKGAGADFTGSDAAASDIGASTAGSVMAGSVMAGSVMAGSVMAGSVMAGSAALDSPASGGTRNTQRGPSPMACSSRARRSVIACARE